MPEKNKIQQVTLQNKVLNRTIKGIRTQVSTNKKTRATLNIARLAYTKPDGITSLPLLS